MSSIARESVAGEPEDTGSEALIGKGQLLLFVALISCFTAWGIATDLTTPMVAGFNRIFDMSTFQASLVQLAYFGAYFLLALPAAFSTGASATRSAPGAVALCLGGKDRFTTAELFENTLLSFIGSRGWKDVIDDEFDWRGDGRRRRSSASATCCPTRTRRRAG